MTTVIIGLDVGKTNHFAMAISADGQRLFAEAVPQEEAALRTMLHKAATYGPPILVLDQSASMGLLPRAVAHDLAIPVHYLPGSTFRHVANSFPGGTKTDRRDAEIIALAGRTMPHAIRPLTAPAPDIADIRALAGYLDDLTDDITRDKNRLRGTLLQLHAPLEQVLGPRLGQCGVLPLLQRYPTPDALRLASDATLEVLLRAHGSRRATRLVAEIREALPRQTLNPTGTTRLGEAIAHRAGQCAANLAEKHRVVGEMETALAQNTTAQLILTMPGYGTRTAATVLVETAGKTFASAAHLASYAGVAPTVRQSGATRQVRRSRTANKRLKDALCWSAFNTIRSGPGKELYQAKRHKGHWKAIIAIARRQVSILYAMLRDGTPYVPKPTPLPLTPS